MHVAISTVPARVGAGAGDDAHIRVRRDARTLDAHRRAVFAFAPVLKRAAATVVDIAF